jgi:hypothetical protein
LVSTIDDVAAPCVQPYAADDLPRTCTTILSDYVAFPVFIPEACVLAAVTTTTAEVSLAAIDAHCQCRALCRCVAASPRRGGAGLALTVAKQLVLSAFIPATTITAVTTAAATIIAPVTTATSIGAATPISISITGRIIRGLPLDTATDDVAVQAFAARLAVLPHFPGLRTLLVALPLTISVSAVPIFPVAPPSLAT